MGGCRPFAVRLLYAAEMSCSPVSSLPVSMWNITSELTAGRPGRRGCGITGAR